MDDPDENEGYEEFVKAKADLYKNDDEVKDLKKGFVRWSKIKLLLKMLKAIDLTHILGSKIMEYKYTLYTIGVGQFVFIQASWKKISEKLILRIRKYMKMNVRKCCNYKNQQMFPKPLLILCLNMTLQDFAKCGNLFQRPKSLSSNKVAPNLLHQVNTIKKFVLQRAFHSKLFL